MTEGDRLLEQSRYLFQTESLLHQRYQMVVLTDADFIKDCKESKYKELDEVERLVKSLINTNRVAVKCNDMIMKKTNDHQYPVLYIKRFNRHMEKMIIIIDRIMEIYDWYVNNKEE